MLLPAGWGFFSNVGGMDSQEDTASAVSPGLLVSLVDVYERERCLNWFVARYTQFDLFIDRF